MLSLTVTTMIEETRRPNPRSRGERTRRRQRLLNLGKDYPQVISPLSISPTKTLVHLENQKNNNMRIAPYATLPKRKTSLSRLLTFGKDKKKKKKLVDFKTSSVEGNVNTLEEKPGASQPGSAPALHNLLQEDGSTDSFKSADSPELCNPTSDPAVESVQWGSQDPEDFNDCLTESAFSVFADSEFLEEIKTPKSKRALWKRIFRTDRKIVHSKTQSDLQSVDVADVMSQNAGAIKKDRIRGRSTANQKKSDTEDISPTKPKEAAATTSPVSKPRTPEPTGTDEMTLRKSAAVGSQLIQQKREEEKKVTGDELRKQLSDGLRNGSGKAKESKTPPGDAIVSEEQPESSSGSRDDTTKEKKIGEKKTQEESGDVNPSDLPGPSNVALSEKSAMSPTEGKREHLYKILVIGELGTGKTSIIKRYVHQFFSQHYRATIGVDFALKVLNWDENSIIRLQLWDIAGQERFGNMTRVYYKEAVGAFIVFDVARVATFDAVLKWKQDLDSKVQLSDGSLIPCILLANKCDQPKEGLVNNKAKMDEFCREKGFATWFETSAKENIHIEEAARALVLEILQNDKLIRNGDRNQDPDKIALDSKSDGTSSKGCSC